MFIADNIKSSFNTILSHKTRSLLTLLGIIIGVLAVVSMFSAVDGIKHTIDESVGKMGWNNSFNIVPKTEEQNGGRWRRHWNTNKRDLKPLNLSDYNLLKRELEYKYMYGMISRNEFNRNSKTGRWTMIKATNSDYFDMKVYSVIQGRGFNRIEENNGNNVCLIGEEFLKKNLDNDKNVIGRKLTLGDYRYTVIGVVGDLTKNDKGNFDIGSWERSWDLRSVFVPLSTGAKYYTAEKSIESIYVQSDNEKQYLYNKNRSRQLLLAAHSMNEVFQYDNISEEMLKFTDQFDDMLSKWNTILLAIASVSLFVGGIGLFSTLLISISERMNEIGIRKSIGATNSDIFFLLLSEAIVLTLIGSTIGIGLAKGALMLISQGLGTSLGMPLNGILVGTSFALIIGILSGLYPAIKAAKVNPIEAVYYLD